MVFNKLFPILAIPEDSDIRKIVTEYTEKCNTQTLMMKFDYKMWLLYLSVYAITNILLIRSEIYFYIFVNTFWFFFYTVISGVSHFKKTFLLNTLLSWLGITGLITLIINSGLSYATLSFHLNDFLIIYVILIFYYIVCLVYYIRRYSMTFYSMIVQKNSSSSPSKAALLSTTITLLVGRLISRWSILPIIVLGIVFFLQGYLASQTAAFIVRYRYWKILLTLLNLNDNK